MSEPVTVIVTCFNLSKYIREAIESVLTQDYTGSTQIIVVDDCSTDDSLDIIGNFKDIEVVHLERNSGVMNATLQGLKRARHDAVFFLDGDDIWHPSKLSECMAILDESAAFITHDLNYVDRDRKPTYRPTRVSQVLGNASSSEYDRLIRQCITRHLDYVWLGSAYGIRQSQVRMHEFFAYSGSKPTLDTIYQDWPIAAWVAIVTSGEMRYVDKALFDYRIHGENYSGDSQTRKKLVRNLTKSRDTMQFIEEMSSFLGFDKKFLCAYSRARAAYELQLAVMHESRITLFKSAIASWKAFGWDRDGAKLAVRVSAGIILGPEKAYRLIEKTKWTRRGK